MPSILLFLQTGVLLHLEVVVKLFSVCFFFRCLRLKCPTALLFSVELIDKNFYFNRGLDSNGSSHLIISVFCFFCTIGPVVHILHLTVTHKGL